MILKKKNLKNRDLLEKIMIKNKIEFRRGNAGGGNQLRQPYIKKLYPLLNATNFPIIDHIHFFSWYVGNFPQLEKSKIVTLCSILNQIV